MWCNYWIYFIMSMIMLKNLVFEFFQNNLENLIEYYRNNQLLYPQKKFKYNETNIQRNKIYTK